MYKDDVDRSCRELPTGVTWQLAGYSWLVAAGLTAGWWQLTAGWLAAGCWQLTAGSQQWTLSSTLYVLVIQYRKPLNLDRLG